eukprot:gene8098-10969_t
MFQNRPSMRRFVECDEVESSETSPLLWEEENIDFKLKEIQLAFSSDASPVGHGNLFITNKRVIWLGTDCDEAFDFDAPYIVLHAITRDTDSYPIPCVYCQLDVDYDQLDEDEQAVDEMFLIPPEESQLMAIFDALSRVALLNPDPQEDDAEEDDGFIYNQEEVKLGAEQARILAHLDSVLQEDPREFGKEDNNEI